MHRSNASKTRRRVVFFALALLGSASLLTACGGRQGRNARTTGTTTPRAHVAKPTTRDAPTTLAERPVGSLPAAVQDAAATRTGAGVLLLGGLTSTDTSTAAIVRVSAGGRSPAVVGTLPAPSSDQSAAAIGRDAYVVGGYTGSNWLNTIVAWRPGGKAHVVARLPFPLRYAAVTAVEGRLLIA